MIYDFHTHLPCDFDKIDGVFSFVSTSNPKDYFFVKQNFKNAMPTYGLHPWNSDKIEFFDEKLLSDTKIIGEIGMDSVWCDINLDIQRDLFIKQLEIAHNLQKPIILHTKGQEKEIFDIISNYNLPKIIIHWYSCENYIELYKNLGCFFTISADCKISETTQKIIDLVDLEHLLIETDGISAVNWVFNSNFDQNMIKPTLEDIISFVSFKKNVTSCDFKAQIKKNIQNILSI